MVRTSELFKTMQGADYVVIDGVVFEADICASRTNSRSPTTSCWKRASGDTEIDMTRAEIDGAVQVGEGEFRLRNGSLVRFLSSAVIH